MFEQDFFERILPFNADAAKLFAIVGAKRKKIGLPISQIDAQIAAILLAHNATLATRDIKDFTECNLNLINPWEYKS